MARRKGIRKFIYTSIQIAIKNLKQLRYQKGTLVMTVVAPTFGFFIMSIALGGSSTKVEVGLYKAPGSLIREFSNSNQSGTVEYKGKDISTKEELMEKLKSKELKFGLDFSDKKKKVPVLYVADTSFLSNKAGIELISKILQASAVRQQAEFLVKRQASIAQTGNKGEVPEKLATLGSKESRKVGVASNMEMPVEVVYTNNIGSFSLFEMTAPGLTGVTIIFFVFIVSGVSFLKERLSGTMERLLISPVSIRELIFGYSISFGLLSVVQVSIFQLFYYKVFKLHSNGYMPLVFAFSFCAMLCSLTLGMFVSSFASTEFQVMQTIPAFLVPQIALSGLFDVPASVLKFSKHLPMTYAVTGFKQILLEGATAEMVRTQIVGLIAYSIGFIFLTSFALKKYKPKFVKTTN